MKSLIATTLLATLLAGCQTTSTSTGPRDWVSYQGKSGPGKGKHIVFLSGDEEYRSEEALPQLAKILSQRHGFKCTVLFSVDTNGVINPNAGRSLTHPEALDSADAIVMALRFRHWPDETMQRFEAAMNRGVPIIALRTSTHAFNGLAKDSPWAKWNYNNKGGFGKQVLGETWVTHWGVHKKEATRGIIEPSAKNDPILRGVEDVFGDTDVYEAAPPADAKILMRGQVLKGMKPTDEPADYKKRNASRIEQGVNDPMMPVAWTREHKNEAGRVNKVFCTTLGSATDFQSEGTRRLVVNGVFWGLGMNVPAKANVDLIGEFTPTMYGFNSFKKGTKPSD
ncbi:MAG TPA: ThuA domain-containing protein [Methylomirabilota bacterium]|nr:ThuA domain-containing protein [Methylomirabilota bacterium]